MSESTRKAFVISLLFNGYWLLCVLGQNQAIPLLLVLLAAAFWYDRYAIRIVPLIVLMGVSVDLLLTVTRVFQFDLMASSGSWLNRVETFPAWLVLLWMGFACYAWLMRALVLKHSMPLLVLVCAFAGASSYYAGMKLGVVTFPYSLTFTLALLTAIWAVLALILVYLIRFFSRNILGETLNNAGLLITRKNADLLVDIRFL